MILRIYKYKLIIIILYVGITILISRGQRPRLCHKSKRINLPYHHITFKLGNNVVLTKYHLTSKTVFTYLTYLFILTC